MKNLFYILLSLALVSVGCDKTSSPVNSDGQPIIGDKFRDGMEFPEGTAMFVSMIKLKSPALLSSAKKDAQGNYIVDEGLKAQILNEQAAMIDELKAISSDIKVLYNYKLVLNALAVEAPQGLASKINQLDVAYIEADENFSQPVALEQLANITESIATNNSMTHIGVDKVHNTLKDENGNPIRGQGVKVGVIDSGIDYTHAMFGGPGSPAAFEQIDANQASPLFPSKKVVGGTDFAGGTFNPGSHIYTTQIPTPDANPLDQGGHGTHVAGTVAGVGDGQNTYDGAAPDAELYALKVFGDAGGGTSDMVVIAALEYAADPNSDLSFEDKLDVVNLSLGGAFGKPHNLYGQAVTNLVKGGTVVVAAAGNAGPITNVVGAPSTADDAISVAASVDSSAHNWLFDAVEFSTPNHPKLLVQSFEGGSTKPIKVVGKLKGKLVYVGTAAQDLSAEMKEQIKGNIAFIDRGEVSFDDKFKRVEGAIGVVVANNEAGDPILMGGDETFEFPGVMVTQSFGETLKAEMTNGDVIIQFLPDDQIEKPEIIDTLAGFSSQGPRLLDSEIKPEISAPGQAITSARMGSGNLGVQFGGTSMASPHVAGIAALAIQYRKNLSAQDIKSLIVSSGKLIDDEKGNLYPISRQGAGRVQVFEALTNEIVANDATLSLGDLQASGTKRIVKDVEFKNTTNSAAEFSLKTKILGSMKVNLSASSISLAAGESKTLSVEVLLDSAQSATVEMDAFILLEKSGKQVGSIPILAVVNPLTDIRATSLNLAAADLPSSINAQAELTLSNQGKSEGLALMFNLLGKDNRKQQSANPFLSHACDLESSGYRIVETDGEKFLQIGAKIFNPVTNWSVCDVNVEIDTNNDQVADKDIYASVASSFPGLAPLGVPGLATMMFNSQKLKDILATYNKELAEQPALRPTIDFLPALEDIQPSVGFDHSTLSISFISLKALGVADGSDIKVKLSVSYNGGDVVERDDVLSDAGDVWKTISTKVENAGYYAIPEAIMVPAGETVVVPFTKGQKSEDLVTYFPRNQFILDLQGNDHQSSVTTPTFQTVVNP